MGDPRYTILADAFALSTSLKTALMIIPGNTGSVALIEFGVSIDAATGRVLVELVESTQATTGTPGSTSGAKQTGGFTGVDTVGPVATYGRKYSAEPTVLTVLKHWWFPAPGPLVIQFPLGREPRSLNSAATKYKGLGIRLKVDSGTPNADAYVEFQE